MTTTIRALVVTNATFRRTIKGRNGRAVPDYRQVPAGTVVDCLDGACGLVAMFTEGETTWFSQYQQVQLRRLGA